MGKRQVCLNLYVCTFVGLFGFFIFQQGAYYNPYWVDVMHKLLVIDQVLVIRFLVDLLFKVVQECSVLQLILPHMVDHTFMAFLFPLQTLWTPWTIFVPLMFPRSSLKTCIIFHTRLLNPFSCIYVGFTSKTAYIGMCAKIQILLEFSLMWI